MFDTSYINTKIHKQYKNVRTGAQMIDYLMYSDCIGKETSEQTGKKRAVEYSIQLSKQEETLTCPSGTSS